MMQASSTAPAHPAAACISFTHTTAGWAGGSTLFRMSHYGTPVSLHPPPHIMIYILNGIIELQLENVFPIHYQVLEFIYLEFFS